MQEKEQIREGARVGEKKVIMQGRSLFVGSNQNESDSGEEEFQKKRCGSDTAWLCRICRGSKS